MTLMRKSVLAGCLLVATAFSADAQRKKPSEPVQQAGFDINQFKNWKPRNIGPSGMSGRITAIDAVIDNPSTIYIGAASGGAGRCAADLRHPGYLVTAADRGLRLSRRPSGRAQL